jgi:hypothetical protein
VDTSSWGPPWRRKGINPHWCGPSPRCHLPLGQGIWASHPATLCPSSSRQTVSPEILRSHFILLFFDGTWVLIQDLLLARLALPLEPCLQPLFALVIFLTEFGIFAWARLEHDSPTYPSCISGITSTYHHAWFIDWDETSPTFCLCWPGTAILPISVSQVAGV